MLYVDLHGHSRKMNIFMYGCENRGTWSLRLRERVFPRMLWRNATCFSYDDCNFKVSRGGWNHAAWHTGCDHRSLCVCIRLRVGLGVLHQVQKAKESTARVVVWKEIGLTNRWATHTPAIALTL